MNVFVKFGSVVGISCLLSGCFFAELLYDKAMEDYEPAPNTQTAEGSLLNLEMLCNTTLPAPSNQGKQHGKLEQSVGNGLTMKYTVKAGKVDKIEVFYPNGVLETETAFSNGLAEGWSQGYSSKGKIRSRFFYRQGRVKQYELYNEQGKAVEKGNCS